MVLDSDDRSLAGRSRSRTCPSYEQARKRELLFLLVRRPPPVRRLSLENLCVSYQFAPIARLKVQLKSELNLSLRYHYVGDDARRAGSIRNESIRLLKHRMVEGIEELGTKLQILILGD